MAISKSQQKAVHKYVKANYDRMELTVPKGQKDTIKAHAAAQGESVNGFIGRAISEAMERDGSGSSSEVRRTTQEGIGVSLIPELLEAAQNAAAATGETLEQFIERAVLTQAQQDKASLRLGINPAAVDEPEKES